MTKVYELPNDKRIMADVDEKHHTATVSVCALDDLVAEVNKTGHWFEWKPEDDVWRTTCSECGEETRTLWHYCPNCGCRMVKPQESEETETWNGIHAQITAPKGTFERIFNDADDDNDI